jgi:glycosyltransferase involved in cell wall biosynthesis
MLEFDEDSEVLASNIGWVRAFSRKYSTVTVWATKVGMIPLDLPSNVTVNEFGGGTLIKRLKAMRTLLWLACRVGKDDEQIFHHMIHYTAIFPGVIFRIKGLKQILWYSHSVAGPGLFLALQFVNHVVAPASGSFPLNRWKTAKALGQAIDISNLERTNMPRQGNREVSKIVSLGRVNRIKNLHQLLEAMCMNKFRHLYEILFVGPIQDGNYKTELYNFASSRGIRISFAPPVKYAEVADILRSAEFYFSGTINAVDRAAIEAAICGAFVVSKNLNLLELSGMAQVWRLLGQDHTKLTLNEQFLYLSEINEATSQSLRNQISDFAKARNSVDWVVSQIITIYDRDSQYGVED